MDFQNAKGTRDFDPKDKILRDKVVQTLKNICENYGFSPVETPIIENYETLAAKFAAGSDSDALKEIFKLSDRGKRKLALRFDMTVPFSRYIALNPNVNMPFKKYMVGEVFRDGPIKTGRYRQFTQFDPDIVGCKGMIADAEIISLIETVFRKLGLDFYIEINNRKILDGVLSDAKIDKKDWFSVTVSIDKLRKIGSANVIKELIGKGLDKDKCNLILKKLSPGKTNNDTLKKFGSIKNENGNTGQKEMAELLDYLKILKVKSIVFNPSLARGLAYYTGPIYEVFLKNSQIASSAAGGGRYDNLIGSYLGSNHKIPATGVSFGIEVIVEALKEKNPLVKKSVVDIFVIPIKTLNRSLEIAQRLRKLCINTDIDLLDRGVSKNLSYANALGIPYVLFVGEKELKQNKVKLRDMRTGDEKFVNIDKIHKLIKS